MDQKTDKLYPSAPFENKNDDLEQRLEKQLNDVNSFKNHINNNNERITYFKDKNSKSKKIFKKNKTITTILESFDRFVIIATTSSSITLSLTGIGLIVIPIPTVIACGSMISKKIVYEITKNKYKKFKKQFEKDQNIIKSFDKLYRKSSQENIIDKIEYEILCNNFTKYIEEIKMNLFCKYEHKNKLFSHNKLKFQPRT